MAFDKLLAEVSPQIFTADGGTLGEITIARPWLFKSRQRVVLRSDVQPTIELQVKRVLSTVLFVGPLDNNDRSRSDVSLYLVVDNATIEGPEQLKVFIPQDELVPGYDLDDLTFESEPTSAKRVLIVDLAGRAIDSTLTGGLRALVTSGGGGGGGGTVDQGAAGVDPWLVTIIGTPTVNQGTSPWVVGDGGGSLTVDDGGGSLTVDGTVSITGTAQVEGTVADSATDAGNPVKIGSRVATGVLSNTGLANGERADAISDAFRRIYVNPSPNIALVQSQATVGNVSPTQLAATPTAGRLRIMIQNHGSQAIYIGGSAVTSADGFRILPNGSITLELGPDIPIYAIAASGTVDVRVLEVA